VRSTETVEAKGDQRWRHLRSAHDQAVRRELRRFGGIEVKHTGDGFLATFDAPTPAVRCAQAIAAAMRPLGLTVRAGVHTGEVEMLAGDVTGITVHAAARIAARAGPGEVLVSSIVKDLSAGSGLRFADRGSFRLKGLEQAWRLYVAVPPHADASSSGA
jgi:class 3 adenylate cyclase